MPKTTIQVWHACALNGDTAMLHSFTPDFKQHVVDALRGTHGSHRYRLVAKVDVDLPAGEPDENKVAGMLDQAYHLTNTIDRYWWENQDVHPVVTKTRSTSVGDVLCIRGVYFVVASFGFDKVEI